jgi:hypothetical protein
VQRGVNVLSLHKTLFDSLQCFITCGHQPADKQQIYTTAVMS